MWRIFHEVLAHYGGEEYCKPDVGFREFEDVHGAEIVDGGENYEEEVKTRFSDPGAGGEAEDVVGGIWVWGEAESGGGGGNGAGSGDEDIDGEIDVHIEICCRLEGP